METDEGTTRGGVVYWRRVADQLRELADSSCVGGDKLLRRDPKQSVGMYRLACQLNTAARRLDRCEWTTPEENQLIRTAEARLAAAP